MLYFKLTITLLEDMHTGSGLGSMLVDDLVQRDAAGYPMINRSHLKGIWRDVGLDIAEVLPDYKRHVNKLFGVANEQATKWFNLSSAHFLSNIRDSTLTWFSSARVPHSREPLDKSLRSKEFVKAGSIFEVELWLRDHELEKPLKQIIARTDHVGARRNRGSGVIKCELVECRQSVGTNQDLPQIDAEAYELVLYLQNRAPLTVNNSSQAGNIITTMNYMPSSVVAGALIAKASQLECKGVVADLARFDVDISPAYPCLDEDIDFKTANVYPIPLSLYSPKYNKELKDRKETYTGGTLADEIYLSKAQGADEQNTSHESLKKTSNNLFIVETKTGMKQFEPVITTSLHNKVSRNRDDKELFSTEHIAEHTRFLCKINVNSPKQRDNWHAFIQKLMLSDCLDSGKGRVPVIVENAFWRKEQDKIRQSLTERDRVTITLTSDLISCNDLLLHHASFTKDALIDAINEPKIIELLHDESIKVGFESRPSNWRSFDTKSNQPFQTLGTISKGSVICIKGNDKIIKELTTQLNVLKALGEYQMFGFGTFVINFNPLAQLSEKNKLLIFPLQFNEEHLCARAANFKLYKTKASPKPSTSQWHDFNNKFSNIQIFSDCLVILELYKGFMVKKGGMAWGSVNLEELGQELENINNTYCLSAIQKYIGYLCRYQFLRNTRSNANEADGGV
jgi:hypothetical protein